MSMLITLLFFVVVCSIVYWIVTLPSLILWPPDLREEHSGRSGIIEADTGCSREESERRAEAVVGDGADMGVVAACNAFNGDPNERLFKVQAEVRSFLLRGEGGHGSDHAPLTRRGEAYPEGHRG